MTLFDQNPNQFQETLANLMSANTTELKEGSDENKPEEYLYQHLLELKESLDEEVTDRRALEDIFKMCFCYVGNYTLSFTLISVGCDLISSILLSSVVGLIPAGSIITSKNGLANTPKIPLIMRITLALITNGLVFFGVALPHIESNFTVKRMYEHVHTIEYGKPKGNAFTQAQSNPVFAGALLLFGAGMYAAIKKHND